MKVPVGTMLGVEDTGAKVDRRLEITVDIG